MILQNLLQVFAGSGFPASRVQDVLLIAAYHGISLQVVGAAC